MVLSGIVLITTKETTMVSVNTNIASLQAQSALKSTQGDYENAMLRLSTGKKINGAADDAAGLSVASSMTSQIKGLKMAAKNASDGISLVNTIEGALDEASDILQRIRELAVQSISDTNNGSDRNYIQDEVNQLNNELNRISSTTQYNSMNVLDGTYTDRTMQIGNLGNQVLKFGVASVDTTTIGAFQRDSVDEVVAVAANHAAAVTALDALYAAAADYTLAGSFGTKTASVDAGADARDVAAAFNLISNETNVKATAITRAQLVAGTAATTYSFTLQGKSSTLSTVTATVTLTTDQTALRDAINAVSGSTGITATLTSNKSAVNLVQAEGYDIIVGAVAGADMTLDAADKDGTVTGSAVTLDFDGNDSSGVVGTIALSSDKAFTVTSGNAANHFSAATTALSSSLSQLGDISLKTVTGSTNAIAVIDTALTMVASSRSGLGAIQNRLTSTVTNLNNIVAKTEQSRAQIVDADYTSETTALSKSQILQQASTAMLAQANKATQGVLQLLQG
jgi:flagellin